MINKSMEVANTLARHARLAESVGDTALAAEYWASAAHMVRQGDEGGGQIEYDAREALRAAVAHYGPAVAQWKLSAWLEEAKQDAFEAKEARP